MWITMNVLFDHKVHNRSSSRTNISCRDKKLLFPRIETVEKYVRTWIRAKYETS